MSLIVDEHRQYLSDTARLSAYRKAINEVVRAGDTVLDLGSGTGILGLLACEAGAKRVYSIEQGGMIEVARAVCRANGFEDRVTFVKGFSTRVDVPEKIDVAVCDQIGRFGFEAGVLDFFNDVRERFLKSGGRLLPGRIDMIVAPVEDPEHWSQVEFWNGDPGGFDFSPARKWAANTGYPVKLRADQLLADPVMLCSIDLAQPAPKTIQNELEFRVARPGILHGIGGWFAAQLSANVVMTNSPLESQPIHRQNVFFPLEHPVPLEPGDRIRLRMHVLPTEVMVSWKVEVWRENSNGASGQRNELRARFAQSTLQGMLISREELERTKPQFTPKLSAYGEARRSILELCDGVRPLMQIEQEVYSRHRKLFPSSTEAAAFVAEVITRYAI